MDEDVWRDIFLNEMQNKEIFDLWDFSVDEDFQAQKGWLQYSLCCFATFCCSICDRNWASSKVHILFFMKLQLSFGQVKMHIFRQKCKVCNRATYEEPMFLVENVEVAIKCLVDRIRQKFYKVPIEDFRRDFVKCARQDGPHDRDNCEACSTGMCNYIKSQDSNSKQKTFTTPEDIHETESRENIQKGMSPYRILSYSPPAPQYPQMSQHPRQNVRQNRNYPSAPEHIENNPEQQSKCCCIIL